MSATIRSDLTYTRTGVSADRPYRVVIIAGAKRGQWGSYPTVEQAAEIAAKLRRHGMYAVVEGAE